MIPLKDLERLPKTDLHCHLDGSVRLATILDLAREDGVKLPTDDPDALFQMIHPGEDCESLEDYLKAFDITLSVMQTGRSLYRAAYELAEDAARENVRWLEVRYSPMLHQRRGLPLTNVVEAVLQGLRAAERDHGIHAGVIICGIRSSSPESSMRMAQLALAYKHRGVVGYDLAGAEYNFPAKHHRAAFQLILDNNINCTAHAGEAYGPESIAQAIHYCGAHRIGHGTRLRENGDLLNYVNDHRVPLEICLTSNVQTRSVPDYESHPLPFFFNFGVRVTINTDNRLVTDTTVSRELWLCQKHFGFTFEDIRELLIAGFKSAFMAYRDKADALRELNRELDAFTWDNVEEQEPGVPAAGSSAGGRKEAGAAAGSGAAAPSS